MWLPKKVDVGVKVIDTSKLYLIDTTNSKHKMPTHSTCTAASLHHQACPSSSTTTTTSSSSSTTTSSSSTTTSSLRPLFHSKAFLPSTKSRHACPVFFYQGQKKTRSDEQREAGGHTNRMRERDGQGRGREGGREGERPLNMRKGGA